MSEDSEQEGFDINISVNQALVAVFALGIAVGFVGGVVAPIAVGPSGNVDTQTDNQQNTKVDFSTDGEPILGDPDAPVTLVMFEDFQCPYCRIFELGEADVQGNQDNPDNPGALEQIKTEYVETGKVKIVWKDFPLNSHEWADDSGAAMECVYRQDEDAFWTLNEKLFQNQASLRDAQPSTVVENIIDWAADEGVSESAVRDCMQNEDPLQEVQQDQQEGVDAGVRGTPTVFINGQKLVGAQPYSRYKSAIESALNE